MNPRTPAASLSCAPVPRTVSATLKPFRVNPAAALALVKAATLSREGTGRRGDPRRRQARRGAEDRPAAGLPRSPWRVPARDRRLARAVLARCDGRAPLSRTGRGVHRSVPLVPLLGRVARGPDRVRWRAARGSLFRRGADPDDRVGVRPVRSERDAPEGGFRAPGHSTGGSRSASADKALATRKGSRVSMPGRTGASSTATSSGTRRTTSSTRRSTPRIFSAAAGDRWWRAVRGWRRSRPGRSAPSSRSGPRQECSSPM